MVAKAAPARRLPRADGKLDQVLSEPGKFIGDITHKVLFTAGESGREGITIKPLTKNRAAPKTKGTPGYATGGDLAYDPNLLNDPDIASKVASGQIRFDPGSNTIGPDLGSPPATSVANQPASVQQVPPAYGPAGTAQWQANNGVLGATQNDINANRGVVAAQAGQTAADRNVIAAQTTELATKRGALGAENSYYDTQSSDNAQSRTEELARQAAENNVADKTAVAQAQRVQDNQDQLFGAFGLSKPIDVTLPAGATTNPAAPGIRAALQTQEQLVTNQNADASKLRTFNTEDSRLAAAKANQVAAAAGLDVTGAQLVSSARGLDVQDAQNAARGTSLDVRQANLGLDVSKQPPSPGMVLDPYSGDFVSTDQFHEIMSQHGVAYDAVNKTYAPEQEIRARTDKSGNVQRLSDGVWVSPQGNELVNGQWVDPKTKNVFDPNAGPQGGWKDSYGNTYVITATSPTGSAQGYWKNPSGYILQGNGDWVDPVSGNTIVNGVLYTPQQLSAFRSTKATNPFAAGAVVPP